MNRTRYRGSWVICKQDDAPDPLEGHKEGAETEPIILKTLKTFSRHTMSHSIQNLFHCRSFSTAASSAITAVTVAATTELTSFTVTPPIHPWPHRLTPKSLASLITCQHDPNLSLQIFLYAKTHNNKNNLFNHPIPFHAILHKLSRARHFPQIEALLNDAQITHEQPLLTVIRGYGLASRPEFALRAFKRIESFGLRPSTKALNVTLNALVQCKRYDLAHLVFKNCKNRFGIVPNVVSCNIMLKALCKGNDMDAAVRVLDEMLAIGVVPNVVSYTTVLDGYVRRGDMGAAKRAFREILGRGWVPDVTAYTALVSGFCRQGMLFDAIKVMDDMEDNGVKPNDVTYGVMIEAFCKGKKSGEALNLLDDMLGKGFVPNSVLCFKVVDMLCEEMNVEKACEVWRKLLSKGCSRDETIMGTLVHWLCKKGKILEARKVFDEFGGGVVASLLTYNTLIAGMCEKGELCEAARLWDDMVEKGRAPNAFTYNMLIKGFCMVGNVKEGIRILEEMLESGCLPNKTTYSMLIDGLSLSGGIKEEINSVVALAVSTRVNNDFWDLFLKNVLDNLDCNASELDRILLENVS